MFKYSSVFDVEVCSVQVICSRCGRKRSLNDDHLSSFGWRLGFSGSRRALTEPAFTSSGSGPMDSRLESDVSGGAMPAEEAEAETE